MARTLATALREAAVALTPSSPSPRLDADVLLRHVTGCSPADLVARAERILTDDEARRLDALTTRRRAGEPVAYLTGEREFWSMTLKVTPAVLIPRPETELLVERALAHVPADARWTVADVGTGSGAIALAIARERPRCRVIASDRSPEALAVARANAHQLGIANVEFFEGEWLEPLGKLSPEMVVSNPPYVRADDPHLNEGDVRFEPKGALIGGADGLDAIRALAQQAFACLMPGGWLLLEHGYDQATAVAAILTEAGFCEIACHRDLAGHDRVTECRAAPTGC
ncbi:MAG: peptide chain release factor N(5)-glutamine methyltransferase [Gammaproteobacteria bacterium]|nr:MAG: peptide chain release factor N(5)-glutamine methyltransferase [Gammaproteobacteria bacterium]